MSLGQLYGVFGLNWVRALAGCKSKPYSFKAQTQDHSCFWKRLPKVYRL